MYDFVVNIACMILSLILCVSFCRQYCLYDFVANIVFMILSTILLIWFCRLLQFVRFWWIRWGRNIFFKLYIMFADFRKNYSTVFYFFAWIKRWTKEWKYAPTAIYRLETIIMDVFSTPFQPWNTIIMINGIQYVLNNFTYEWRLCFQLKTSVEVISVALVYFVLESYY